MTTDMWVVQNVNGVFYGPFTDAEKAAWQAKIGGRAAWRYLFHRLCKPKPCIPAKAQEKSEARLTALRKDFSDQRNAQLTRENHSLRETNAKLRKVIAQWE